MSSPALEGKWSESDRIVRTRAPKRRGSERNGALRHGLLRGKSGACEDLGS